MNGPDVNVTTSQPIDVHRCIACCMDFSEGAGLSPKVKCLYKQATERILQVTEPYIDRLGRRKLLLAGLIGMGGSLAVVGIAFQFIAKAAVGAASTGPSEAGIVTLFALVAFIICFAFSMGPVTWTVINEVFPGHIRGRAVAVATAVNWGAAFLVSQSFLSLIEAMGISWTFGLFALFCGVAWIWIFYRAPETKGQSLEQIQQLWKATP